MIISTPAGTSAEAVDSVAAGSATGCTGASSFAGAPPINAEISSPSLPIIHKTVSTGA